MTHRIALVHNDAGYLYRFRLALMRSLISHGAEVYAIAPAGDSASRIEEAGVKFIPWKLDRGSVRPWLELKSLLSLIRIYRRIRPSIAHHFTVKPNIYGPIASRASGVPIALGSITGLGYVYTEDSLGTLVLRRLVSQLYRLAFSQCAAVTFQTLDDLSYFESAGIVRRQKANYFTGGSGVDTAQFNPEAVTTTVVRKLRSSFNIGENDTVVLLAARMLWHKGIGEFVEAARRLNKASGLHFLLAGSIDEGNPASIPPQQIEEWSRTGWITYIGEREDIQVIIALSDIVTLPSYREGVPRILIEAAAMGKPIVACDISGCRDVVVDNHNGLLISPRDADALVHALEVLLADKDLRHRFGIAGRAKCLKEFDQQVVVEQHIHLYERLLAEAQL